MPPLPGPPLHLWNLSPEDAVTLQQSLAGRVNVSHPAPHPIRTVAGCDIAYDTDSPTLFAAVVVVRVEDLAVVEQAVVTLEAMFPYVPGLLSFREAPPVLAAWEKLRGRPDCAMLDAQGVAHPRRFGLACHLGLWLDLPAVGCAKSRLVGEYAEPGPDAGDTSPLVYHQEQVGVALRSAAGAKPVFVSPGHRIDVAGATEIVRATLGGHRHPVPTRLAHMAANAARAAARGDSGSSSGGAAGPAGGLS